MAFLSGSLVLFEFEEGVEAERVLQMRLRFFAGKGLNLFRWSLEEGFLDMELVPKKCG